MDSSLHERILLGFIAASWISRDARTKAAEWPADYTFIFFPVVLPIYLFLTRRWMGIVWQLILMAVYTTTFVIPDFLTEG